MHGDQEKALYGEEESSEANDTSGSTAENDNAGQAQDGASSSDQPINNEQQSEQQPETTGDQQGAQDTSGEDNAGEAQDPFKKKASSINKDKLTIKDYQKYNVDKLRCNLKNSKFTEDPFALMANRVWTRDYLNPNNLVFEYSMVPDVIPKTTLFSKTYQLLEEIRLEEEQKGNDGQLSDKDFRSKFLVKLELYLLSRGIDAEFQASIFDVWISQICYQLLNYVDEPTSTKLETVGGLSIIFTAKDILDGSSKVEQNEARIMSFAFAQYFIFEKFANNKDTFLDRYKLLKNRINILKFIKNKNVYNEGVFNALAVEPSSALIKANELKDLTTSNSDVEDQKKPSKFINTNAYYLDTSSAKSTLQTKMFVNVLNSYNVNAKNLDAKEQKLLAKSSSIKKCRETQKNETALRMFYKEGNDNILNGTVPNIGLGCDKKTTEWLEAVNNFFDSDKLQKVRKNLKIPYYFVFEMQAKDPILKDNKDIENIIITPSNTGLFKNLQNRLLHVMAFQKKYVDPNTYQQDKNFWIPSDKSKENLLDVIWKKFVELSPPNPFQSYHPIYNVGHVLGKQFTKPPTNGSKEQKFYFTNPTNPAKTKILFNDSQINYGKKYNYNLNQVLTFFQSSYDYTKIDFDFSKNNADLATSFFQFNATFKTKLKKEQFYRHNISIEEVNKVKYSLNSFSDLPPRGLSLQIFPQRGVNNRLMMLFEKTVYGGVEKKKVGDPSTWPDLGWKESKEFYLEDNKGISASDDEMFFGNATIGSIELYFKTGEKPKSIMDIKELFGSINTFEQGFQAQAIIEPNTKYYFYIKAISVTGLESYPSPVYQVELVDDGGTVFPLIEVVNFDEKEKRPETLSFSDRFRIEPALLQQAPNPSTDDVGYLTPVVWSDYDETKPRFKVRLTSKKTGKKVDFNIIYRKKIYKDELGDGPLSPASIDKDKILISYKKNSKES